jgi:hypothetical protein
MAHGSISSRGSYRGLPAGSAPRERESGVRRGRALILDELDGELSERQALRADPAAASASSREPPRAPDPVRAAASRAAAGRLDPKKTRCPARAAAAATARPIGPAPRIAISRGAPDIAGIVPFRGPSAG